MEVESAQARIPLTEVPSSGTRVISIGGCRVLLCRSGENIYAVGEMCPHQRLSLDGGRIRGDSIICPHHGARFNLVDGRSMSPLTAAKLSLYDTYVAGDELIIQL